MKTLLLIDGNSLANRAFYGVPRLTNAKGVPTNALFGFLNTMQAVVDRFAPDALFVAFDISKKVFRHEQFADYKGTRTGMPEELQEQMPLIKEALKYMNVETFGIEGYEADDIIGTLSRHYSEEGVDCFVLSGDRDLFQLVSEKVTVCFPKSKGNDMEVVTPDFLQENYQLTPELVIEMKGLMGDKSDNIPGIAGVGEKTAKKMLEQYGSIEGLYEHLDDYKGKKIYDKLLNGKEDAFMSRTLATIKTDVPMDFTRLDFSFDAPDVPALAQFYKDMGLTKLLKQLEERHGMTTIDLGESAPTQVFEGSSLENLAEAEAVIKTYKPDRFVMMVETDKEGHVQRFSWRHRDQAYTLALDESQWPDFVALWADVLSEENTYLVTDDAKKLAVQLMRAGVSPSRISWDIMLASYLLQPESGDHDLARIAETRLGLLLPEEGDARSFAALDAIVQLGDVLKKDIVDTGIKALYKEVELPLAGILAEMEQTGVRIDVPYLEDLQLELDERIKTIQADIDTMAGESVNSNSPKQLGHILFEVLGLPVVKKTKTGYSTSAEVLETLKDVHPIVQRILDFRQLAKLKSTYVDGLLKLADEKDLVHTSFNQMVTATGRLSSTAPNLQNIPVRTEEGRRIRRAFVPIENTNILISADYSQIELRVLAHLSQDNNLMHSFLENEDIHRRTASEVFHVPMEEVTSEQRRTAKAVNFGIIYGQTDFGLSKELGISRREAKDYIDMYFSRYPEVESFIAETVEGARKSGYVTTMLGRRRYIKDIESRNRNLRQFAERTAVNSPIQGTAADIIKLAMLRCDQAIRDNNLSAKMLLQVHDELIFEVTKEDAMKLGKIIRQCMEEAVSLSVPLKVDLKAGFNWMEMERI